MINKYLIFGTGSMARGQLNILKMLNDQHISILAFVDNDANKWGGEFEGYPIIAPSQIETVDFDYISIWSTFYNEIRSQLMDELHIQEDKLKSVFLNFIEKCEERQLRQCKNKSEISESKYFFGELKKKHVLRFMEFQPEREQKLYEVYFDDEKKMDYVFFEGKRMYLSRSYQKYVNKDGKKYINDIWYEQDLNSPHRYEEGEVYVKEGDVLLDAGVCEGNFTLHNIEKVKKAYLVECDPDWMEALQYTFAPYKEKVVFVPKFLSDEDRGEKIRIDTLIPEGEEINFLKMDIEGEEIKALEGGINTISSSADFRCAVCAYHKHGDEGQIKTILQNLGIKTTTSKGYVMFIYDKDIYVNPELRRGVVRGKR